jgi:hypothetical protein
MPSKQDRNFRMLDFDRCGVCNYAKKDGDFREGYRLYCLLDEVVFHKNVADLGICDLFERRQ